MQTLLQNTFDFELPDALACPLPTEDRGLRRDDVRLLVTQNGKAAQHDIFRNFDTYLERGDVLVVNTSAMIASALPVSLPNGLLGRLHLSTRLSGDEWLVEIRALRGNTTARWRDGKIGMGFDLPGGGRFVLKRRFYKDKQFLDLWIGTLHSPQGVSSYLEEQALPIKYTQLESPFPLSYYQTYFSFHKGSAEMPSASRGFTQTLMQKLLRKGVRVVPILLHTGVSSLEDHERPYPEYVEVDPVAAMQLNVAKAMGKRIIAVGTTAVRAVESAADKAGLVHPFRGHTELYIDSQYKMKVANGLVTGFHEPKASHLHMLQAMAGQAHISAAYKVALASNYHWHQFGDLHLIF